MTEPVHSQRMHPTLEEAVVVAGRARGEDADCFAAFARDFLRGTEGRPLLTHGVQGLVAVASEAFEFARHCPRGERRIRVRFPEALPGRSVIELLQPDRPFLVDTIRLFLRRHALQEQMLLHPTLASVRDEEGVLRAVGGEGASQESLIFVEAYPRVSESRAREFEVELNQLMGWVENVTDDHRRMIRFVREVGANLEYAARYIEGGEERVAKIDRFLDWLVEEHFVFMGTRGYDVRRVDGELEIALRIGQGLGMWRGNEDSRFREPRRGAAIPAGLQRSLEDSRIVQVSKGWTESHVHRAGRIDRIIVKELDDQGQLSGFSIIAGLFTYRALRTPCSQLPLLAERLQQILEEEGALPGSHRYKAIVTAFDSAPMEFLLGAEVADNAALIREIVDAEGAEEPSVVLRADAGERSFYVAVILPRARYSEELRSAVRTLLVEKESIGYVDDRVSFLEEGTALLHFFCTLREGDVPLVEELEVEVQRLASRWDDQLTHALIARFGAAEGSGLAARYVDAFPESLQVAVHPIDAVRDVEALEALHRTREPQVALFFERRDVRAKATMLRIYLAEEWLISKLLPVVDHFGIQVIEAWQTPLVTRDRAPAFIHALRVLPLGGSQADLDALSERLGQGLRNTLLHIVPNDALNALVLVAGLDWREIELIRTYLEYFNQIQSTLTRSFVVDVLLRNPVAVRLFVELHAALLGPGEGRDARERRTKEIRDRFERYRDRIPSLNEDRALGAILGLIEATLRTNFFASVGSPQRIAIKLDPSRISSLKPPFPYREIFVHGSEVDGIHIRGGPVARGGIRWSDRIDDFRTEVLGLMRTQQLKNGLIVPVGAKGGFVLRTMDLTPQEARERADEGYRVFIAGLLDLTDDVDASGRVVAPSGVMRRDADDPYLVVAADKGTAHLSDTANALALERGFWLGDAFASGGSVGYDHKKYAITARGAWECVKHHFAEMGLDPETESYSVVGIGDMSGDVFGNGLLLMRQAKLVAAFDHRHIFVDPDPDPEPSWQERQRLFALPRSSWEDYDRDRLSPGGGVWPRSAKRIDLSAEACRVLGLEESTLTGPELVQAILAAPVDLLWNGGIGTYVKATHERQTDVGDRANDAVRIDAAALRARVVGEGGNLGLTQAARIEAARAGVRLDTDAIHNSAGVDLSDHEVNYKILLAPLLQAGLLSADERAVRLSEVAEDACESVLAHNRDQVMCISLDERRSKVDLEPFRWAIETLCGSQGLPPAELVLPDDVVLRARSSAGEGLVRPELAALLGLAKLHTRQALAHDPYVDHVSLEPLFESVLPASFRARYPEASKAHRLRREMTALALTNRLIDVGGVTAITTLTAKRGLTTPTAAAALLSADGILDGPALRQALLGLRSELGLEPVYDALLELGQAIQEVARYLLAEGLELASLEQVAAWREALFGLAGHAEDFLSSEEAERLESRRAELREIGLPDTLAGWIAGGPLADRGLNVIRLIEQTKHPAVEVARAYARLGESSGINWVFQNLPRIAAGDLWDRMVLTDLRTQTLSLQRVLVEEILQQGGDDPLAAIDAFVASREEAIRRVQALQAGAQLSPSASALTVVTQALQRLRAAG